MNEQCKRNPRSLPATTTQSETPLAALHRSSRAELPPSRPVRLTSLPETSNSPSRFCPNSQLPSSNFGSAAPWNRKPPSTTSTEFPSLGGWAVFRKTPFYLIMQYRMEYTNRFGNSRKESMMKSRFRVCVQSRFRLGREPTAALFPASFFFLSYKSGKLPALLRSVRRVSMGAVSASLRAAVGRLGNYGYLL